VNLDFSGLDAQLVAITGANGAGKTMLLELLAGALYRQCPTRGSLVKLAPGCRDGLLEARVVNGRAWTVRHLVDGVSGKSEASVTDDAGQPALQSSKVRDFDAWAATHLPPAEVLYSSSVAVQGRRGFLDLSPADRKRVLLRVLGTERLEGIAERARERAREAAKGLEIIRARLADEQSRGVPMPIATADLETAEHRLVSTRGAVQAAQTAWDEAQLVAERARAEQARREEFTSAVAAAEARVTNLATRVSNNETVLERADAIRAAVSSAGPLDEACSAAQAAHAAATVAEAEAKAAWQAAADKHAAIERALAETGARVARATTALREMPSLEDVQAAVAALPDLRAQAEQAAAHLGEAREAEHHGKDRRIEGLRGGLEAAAGGDLDAPAAALRVDDATAAEIAGAPARRQAGELAMAQTRDAVQAAETTAALSGRREATAAELGAAVAAQDVGQAELSRATDAIRDALVRLESATAEARAAGAVVSGAGASRAALGPLLAQAEPLAQAEARLADLRPELATAREQLAAAEAELRDLRTAEAPATPSRTCLDAAETAERLAVAEAATSRQRLEDATASQARLADLEAQTAGATVQHADWTRLAHDLGREGLQAYEIDAAVPELNQIANTLLHDCHGSRFTVEVTTQRLSADGKRSLEGLDVRVIDTERGRDDLVETFSGGECVIVGEAVSLALTMMSCRRSGMEGPTLLRDESGAALDPANTRAYAAMLRQACSAIGASRCLFVSHSAEMQGLADARIEIADGKAEVVLP